MSRPLDVEVLYENADICCAFIACCADSLFSWNAGSIPLCESYIEGHIRCVPTFFTGKWDYFLLLNGFALYFVLDIFYNSFFSKKSGNWKRRLRRDEKLNYHHLAGAHESKKFLERLEFDSYGFLVNVDYNQIEIFLGNGIIICISICFAFGVKNLILSADGMFFVAVI